MITDDELVEIREAAAKQTAAYARMLELDGGVGLLGIREPQMFKDMLTWDSQTGNNHADTVQRLLEEIERLRTEAYETSMGADL